MPRGLSGAGPFTIGSSTVLGDRKGGFIAQLGNVLTSTQAASGPMVGCWPNPAHGQVQVAGLPPGQPVQVVSMVGQVVAQAMMPAQGALRLALPPSLMPGLYLVRSPGADRALRLLVE